MKSGGRTLQRLSSDLGIGTVALTFLTLTVNGAMATGNLILKSIRNTR